MRNDLTDLTVVLDRSGSMAVCKTDAESGLNEFVKRQKEQPGECLFSLVQFDHEYEFVYTAKPIRDVLAYALFPRGNTALLDAIGRAIIETGERLKKMDETQRLGLVVFVIITDGCENASNEFTRDKIKEMIEHQSRVYKWQFTFLGANQDAFAEARRIGIPKDSTANYAGEKTSGGILAAHANVARMRHCNATGQHVNNAYTDEERKAMTK